MDGSYIRCVAIGLAGHYLYLGVRACLGRDVVSGGDYESIAEEGTAVLEIASPELWNTENPYLYKLILETENEVIVDYIALRKIEIKDQVIYLNGQKIKFRGVNRHDSDPVTGFTISREQIITDLTLMKQHKKHKFYAHILAVISSEMSCYSAPSE